MRNFFLMMLGSVVLLASCTRTDSSCTNVSLQQDDQNITTYMSANSFVNFTKDPSGVYYNVILPGSAPYVNSGSRVWIKYTGKLLDASGTIFDQAATPAGPFSATGFISGFQVALSKIGKGGKVQAFIPSNLAYGCNGAGSIPANASIFFDIELVDVQ